MSFVELLRSAGYRTLHSGKEHFDKWVPQHCYAGKTCDESLTFWATTEYFVPPDGTFERPFYRNGREIDVSSLKTNQKPFYKTDVFTDYALNWLGEAVQKKQPFFLSLPYHSAHYPLQARPEDIAGYRGRYRSGWDRIREARFQKMKGLGIIDSNVRLSPPEGNINRFRGHPGGFEEEREKFPLYRPWDSLTETEKDDYDLEMAVFAAMVDRMDQNIGRILKKLEVTGQLDNTLIVFLSDNGSCPYDSNTDFTVPPGPADSYRCLRPAWANVGNTPFRYFKQYGHEGGCNTHFIAHWPGVIPPGRITQQPGHVVDLFPTFLDACQLEYPKSRAGESMIPLHGRSLLPVLRGGKRPEPDFLLSGFSDRFRMFRQGPWKIVRANGEDWELYNLDEDPTEIRNLADSQTQKLAEIVLAYQKIQLNP